MGDKNLKKAGREVNNIAESLRDAQTHNRNKKKRKKIVIIIIVLLLIIGIAVGVVLAMMGGERLDVDFLANNVDAKVVVYGKVINGDNTSIITVNGGNDIAVEFNPEDMGENGTAFKSVNFNTSASIGSSTLIQLFYEFENRSDYADMFVTYDKAIGEDNNFRVSVCYKVEGSEYTEILTYFAVGGKYYTNESEIGDITKAVDKVTLNEAIRMPINSKMTMRVEAQVYNSTQDAICNFNHTIKMINANNYTPGA